MKENRDAHLLREMWLSFSERVKIVDGVSLWFLYLRVKRKESTRVPEEVCLKNIVNSFFLHD